MANDRSDAPMGVTGSTTVINPVSAPIPITTFLVSAGSNAISATTAGTSILIPSTATGSIYLTNIIANAGTASTIQIGYGTGVVAPTTTAIVIQPMYLSALGTISLPLHQAIKIPSSNNLLITFVGGSVASGVATYYVAP